MGGLFDNFLNVFFPRRCVGCGKVGTYYCESCIKHLETVSPFCIVCKRSSIDGFTHSYCRTPFSLDGVFAVVSYKHSVKKAVRLLKYHSVSDLSFTLSSLISTFYPHYLPRFDFLSSVPLHPKRERLRGYNQSSLLARHLSQHRSFPYAHDLLFRTRFSKPQVELSGEERQTSLVGAFSVNPSFSVLGKTIGIVDDVTTTGATLLECGSTLKRAGASSVWGIVLAHGS